MSIPRPLRQLIEAFERLPGIGPKTAQRLTFYLLHVPQEELDLFAEALSNLKRQTEICEICKNVDERNPCRICEDSSRDHSIICVVESPLDVLAIEGSGYRGAYHVLHGVINPLANIGPDEIFIKDLKVRLESDQLPPVKEIILATGTSMEGEATALYIARLLRQAGHTDLIISRIGRGLPTGADLEYADKQTLSNAISGRVAYQVEHSE